VPRTDDRHRRAMETLEAPGIDRLQGAGIYYGGGATEALSCEGEIVYVVGGANSAGQAAMNSQYAERVILLVRGESLSSTMSQYLIDQVQQTPRFSYGPMPQLWRPTVKLTWKKFPCFVPIPIRLSAFRRMRCLSSSEHCRERLAGESGRTDERASC